MDAKPKPSRNDLLRIICRLQDLIGMAMSHHGNDRDRNGFEKGQNYLKEAFELAISAQEQDDPDRYLEPGKSPWRFDHEIQ